MTSQISEELSFKISSLTIAAKAWGPTDGLPVLAFHGWLDNAATFDYLAPLLPELRLICLDMPGHGLSDHRPPGVSYHFVDMLFDVVEVLDSLGWEHCSLLGHSMGAGVATCISGLLGNRINNTLLIEGLGPLSQPTEHFTELMRDALEEWLSLSNKQPPVYVSRDEAIRARQIAGDMQEMSVKALVKRGLEQKEEGYVWRSDPRLRVKSRIFLNEDQVQNLIQAIISPVLVIEARDSRIDRWHDLLRSRLKELPILRHRILPGGHHLHLDQPEFVAEAIQEFLRHPPVENE